MIQKKCSNPSSLNPSSTSVFPGRSIAIPRTPRLGVNIDHVATLRELRGTPYPSLCRAVDDSIAGGAKQITIHLREDRRHIQDADVKVVRAHLKKAHPKVLLNLELAMAEEIRTLALRLRPEWVCVVPERRQEVTTEGGLDLTKRRTTLQKFMTQAKKKGVHVSLFIEPSLQAVRQASDFGADAVELHTGAYCLVEQSRGKKAAQSQLRRIEAAGRLARELGMGVHAGHGIDHVNIGPLVALRDANKRPLIAEYNIGHFLICRSVSLGLRSAVKEMARIVTGRAPALRKLNV